MHKIACVLVLAVIFFLNAGCDCGEKTKNTSNVISSETGSLPAIQDDAQSKPAVSLNSSLIEKPHSEAFVEEEEIEFDLKYKKYLLSYSYVVADKSNINIRETPFFSGKILKKTSYMEKINYIETVTGDYSEKYKSSDWHHIFWVQGNSRKFGFIYAPLVKLRVFKFEEMLEAIAKIEKEKDGGRIAYINNYKNIAGISPKYRGKEKDAHGNRRDQSAPGYFSLNDMSNFIYIEDGTLLKIISSQDGFYKVKLIKDGLEYFVPQKYIPKEKSLSDLTKAVVIDRKNQNEAAFEKKDGKWAVVSYSLATTGANNEYKMETPLGYFYAIEKRDKFIYLNDETKEVEGYAPYAVRFTGGAYIHGIPVKYIFENGKRTDPGKIEYSRSIGTIPLSHKCVRNYTSHAKFLYDWIEIGTTAIIVIE